MQGICLSSKDFLAGLFESEEETQGARLCFPRLFTAQTGTFAAGAPGGATQKSTSDIRSGERPPDSSIFIENLVVLILQGSFLQFGANKTFF